MFRKLTWTGKNLGISKKMWRTASSLLVVGVSATVISACGASNAPAEPMEPISAEPESTAAPMEVNPTDPAQTTGDTDNVVDVAMADGRFATLVTALQAAGLVETLQGEGPFAVFAPTDEAFSMLPAGALDGLLQDPDALSNVLLYHVVPQDVMAEDVVNMDSVETAQGQPIDITVTAEGTVMVNDAQVIATDIEAANGTIHVIDSVLMAPQG